MATPPRGLRTLATVTLLSAGALGLLYLSISGGRVGDLAKGAGGALLTPFTRLAETVGGFFGRRMENERTIDGLRRQLEDAQRELLASHLIDEELQNVRREKAELERLLGVRKDLPWKNVASRVVLRDPQNLFTSLVIDRGSRDGVADGDPVIVVEKGRPCLIGRVAECGPDRSKVLTLIDPRHQVVVQVPETGDQAIARGMAPGRFSCMVDFLDRRLDGLEGKVLVTAGTGGRYPKGLLVGTIGESVRRRYGIFQQAFLVPQANFFRLENVFILVQRGEAGETRP